MLEYNVIFILTELACGLYDIYSTIAYLFLNIPKFVHLTVSASNGISK